MPRRAKDDLPERAAPQLATLVDAPPKGNGWAYEIKLDGYRILARCEHGHVRMFTRNENDWTGKMQSLADEVSRLPVTTAWLDGEVVIQGTNGVPDFNALQNAFDSAGTEQIVYFVFDLLYLKGKDLRREALSARRTLLEHVSACKRTRQGVRRTRKTQLLSSSKTGTGSGSRSPDGRVESRECDADSGQMRDGGEASARSAISYDR